MTRLRLVGILVPIALIGLQPTSIQAAPPSGYDVAPFAPHMPSGWRDLKWGMPLPVVRKVLYGYRDPWIKDEFEKVESNWAFVLRPPTGAADARIEQLSVEYALGPLMKRLTSYSIVRINDSAKYLHAWFDRGKLVAVYFHGAERRSDHIALATEAYGAAPRTFDAVLKENASKPERVRCSFWRGGSTVVLSWPTSLGPAFLVMAEPHYQLLQEELAKHDVRSADAEKNVKLERDKATRPSF